MAYSYLDSYGSPFYNILKRETEEARENKRTYLEVLQCETIFLFVLSLYTKLAYFINNLIGQGRHVIEDVEKGKVQELKKYCEVALATYRSFLMERAELTKCMDQFIENNQLPVMVRITRGYFGQELHTLVVRLMKEDLMKMFKLNLEPELKNLTATEKLDKISHNVGQIQRSVVNTVEMITHEMYKVLEYGNHLQKSSCFNDYLRHHKLEGSSQFSFTRPLPKLWMCNRCWQWNKNKVLYTNTQSAACEHCGEPIIPGTRGKFNNLHVQCFIDMVNW